MLIGLTAAALAATDRTLSSESPALLVGFADGGKTLAALCGDGKLRLWDVESGTLRQTHGREPMTSPRVFLSGNDQFATVARDGTVQVWDGKGESIKRQLPAITPRATRLAVSDDGSRVATAHMPNRQTSVNTIHVRNAEGTSLFSAPAGIGGISVLRFSPDGSLLLASSYDADLRIWSVSNGELVQLIDSLPVSMFAASFSPDGKWLAAAGMDRTVYIWDAKTWKLARTIKGQPEMISALEFSPDGRRLATGGFSELTARHPVRLIVWDVATAKPLRTMNVPRRVSALAFSPDGGQVASSYGDTAVNVWQVPQ
jgi:WD40 repeat protein